MQSTLSDLLPDVRSTEVEDFETFPDPEDPREKKRLADEKAWANRIANAGIPPRYAAAALDTNCEIFAGDEEKAKAYDAAMQLVRSGEYLSRGAGRLGIVFGGDFGTGKTWLATAVLKSLMWKTNRPGRWVKYYQFVRDIQAGYGVGGGDEALHRFQNVPFLVLDDIGGIEREQTADRRQLFYELIDRRNDLLLPTIVTTNLTTDTLIEQFGERVFNRLLEIAGFVKMGGANYRVDLPVSDK